MSYGSQANRAIETAGDDIWIWHTSPYEGFQEAVDKNLGRIESNPPDELYHYTSAGGLKGIINSQAIRMTDLRYMNDAAELEYAVSLIREILEDRRESAYGWEEELLDFLLGRSLSIYRHFNIYAACFCEARNKSSFWSSYGKYSAVIDTSDTIRVESSFTSLTEWDPVVFRKVIYNEPDQREIIREKLESSIVAFEKNRNQDNIKTEKLLSSTYNLLENLLIECITSFKDPIYREEEEWRMIFFQMNRDKQDIEETETLVKGDYLVPYVDMKFVGTNEEEYSEKINLFSRMSKYKEKLSESFSLPEDIAIPTGEDESIYPPPRPLLEGYHTMADHLKAAEAVGKFPLKRVHVGPVQHSGIALKSVKMELVKNELEEVDVRDVDVPLRSGW